MKESPFRIFAPEELDLFYWAAPRTPGAFPFAGHLRSVGSFCSRLTFICPNEWHVLWLLDVVGCLLRCVLLKTSRSPQRLPHSEFLAAKRVPTVLTVGRLTQIQKGVGAEESCHRVMLNQSCWKHPSASYWLWIKQGAQQNILRLGNFGTSRDTPKKPATADGIGSPLDRLCFTEQSGFTQRE